VSEASSGSELAAPGDLSLEQLGTGGRADRLGFKVVLGLLWRCAHLLRPVRKHLIRLFLGFSAVAIAFLPLGVLLFDAFFTRILQGEPLLPIEATFLGLDPAVFVEVESLDPDTRRALLRRVIFVGVGSGVVVSPVIMALYYYQVWILQRVNQILRVQLLERFQSLSLRFHAENRVGDAIYRMYQDSAMVTQLIDVLFLTPAMTVSRFAFSLVVIALFDPWLALLLGVLVPPLLGLGAWLSQRMRVRFRAARESNSALTSRIQETLSGIKVIKAYGAEGLEQARFEAASETAFAAAFRARGLLAFFLVAIFWTIAAGLVAAGAISAFHTRSEDPITWTLAGFTIWNLGLFNYAKARFGDGASQARHLFRTWGRTQDIAIGLDRVFEVLDLEPEVQDAADARPLDGISRGVTYRDVHFRYQPDRPALESVSFNAAIGTITAIVGPTGAGKTTLMALLLRLFDPAKGVIEIDGRDIRGLQIDSLRANVAVALQENLLFGTTIRENVRYAVPNATDEQVRAAARVVCADEFIEAQEEGYDTLLGERGTKLSTGQRQRLSIARAVLKDTPILILDEPTAALDAETELRVMQNLAEWGKGRLIFLITHRLSTIRRADQILVLRDGVIAEYGPHEELITKPGGAYRNLVETEISPAAALAGVGG
jgi:ATP-binding cassette subfamily B protein